jgi:putative toxin-antitoxin system antitoxin component (TIGR02293 family)
MDHVYPTFPEDDHIENVVSDFHAVHELPLTKQRYAGRALAQKFAHWEAIQNGVGHAAFESIRKLSPFSDADWARFLDISTKSLLRYRQDSSHRFKPGQSETILEVAELCTVGIRVFGTSEAFNHWLGTPNGALAGKYPHELVGSSYGQQLLLDELIRIDQGIFA